MRVADPAPGRHADVAQEEKPGLLDRVRQRVRALRDRWPSFDHVMRAYDRNSEVQGSQLAAAITYFGFLSFFPLLALAFAVVGFVSEGNPDIQRTVTDAVEQAFPGLVGTGDGQLNIQDVIDAKAGATVIGLLGLLYSGLGWIDALRDALRRVFGTSDAALPLLKKKLVDILVLTSLGVALLASLAVSALATRATQQVLDKVGLGESLVALVVLKVLAVLLALLADTLLFAILLSRLSGAQLPWRQVRSGAVVAAVGFEVLKLFATFLIGRATNNPLYATFGVIVGLLIWINFVSKLLMFAAAWTATQPYSLEPVVAGEDGAGRSTGLAAGTEPVSVVAPADFEPVPAEETEPGPRRRAGWRRAAIGAAAGASVAAALTRRARQR
ncbi:MAG: rane protein [Actinomycetota bacterium]|nr:rane protein [Actinomycetota bacterium]MDQ1671116.1 rane protein [Actinomycetota bacterium]